MKKVIVINVKQVFSLALFIFSCLTINAQIFWTENFDANTCVAGSGCSPSLVVWSVTSLGTNGGAANVWYVSDTESGMTPPSCGAAGMGNQSLHVGNVSTSSAAAFFCPTGDCGAAYDDSSPNEATNKRAESPVIDCTGKTNIIANFNYIEKGKALTDNGSFWYFDGATWTQLDPIAKSPAGCAPQGRWTAVAAISLPVSANNNPNVKIGFLWTNNGDGNAADPSFAVDDVTLCSNCLTLPIELVDFRASQLNSSVELYWETASEQNNDYFTVEKSEDGKNWDFVAKVDGMGTTNTLHSYQTTDFRPYSDISYYRLKQTDINGAFNYSKIILVNETPDGNELIFPQPSKDKFTLQTSIIYQEISLWNALGKQVNIPYTQSAGAIIFDSSKLSEGVYFLHLRNENSVLSKKVIIQ